MKKIIITAVILFSSLCCKAQLNYINNDEFGKTIKFNNVSLGDIMVASGDFYKYSRINKKTDLTINGKPVIGCSANQVINHFGKPEKIENFYFEMDDTSGFIYYYDGLKLFIQNGRGLESFEINSSEYSITNNNLKVGESIETLKNNYPKSYYQSNDKESTMILFNDADYFLAIKFNSVKIITNINLYEF